MTTGANGFGLVSYPYDDFGNRRAAHCLDAACSSAAINIISESMSVGSNSTSSIAVDSSGFGLISLVDLTDFDLMVGRCTNIACSSMVTTTVDSVGSVGSHSSIAVGADGRAWISYFDHTNEDLKVVRPAVRLLIEREYWNRIN